MPRTCTICNHKKRKEIDQALVNGQSLRNIAARYGTTSGSLKRHKDSHLPRALKEAKHAETILSSENILEKMQDLHNKTLEIFDGARRRGDDRLSISAAREVRENIKLLSELTGLLKDQPEVNVQVVVEQSNLLVEIFMEALRSELGPEESRRVISYIEKRRQNLIAASAASGP